MVSNTPALVIFLIKSLVSGIHGRHIYVSQSKGSNDTLECSSLQTPCLTVKFAVESVADNFDHIIIDGGNKTQFTYISTTIKVTKSLTLLKHNSNKLPILISISPEYVWVFDMEYNNKSYTLSLNSLIINTGYAIHAERGSGNIIVSNCIFSGRSFIWFSEGIRNYTFKIYSSVLTAHGDQLININGGNTSLTIVESVLNMIGGSLLIILYHTGRDMTRVFWTNTTFVNGLIHFRYDDGAMEYNYKLPFVSIKNCTFDNSQIFAEASAQMHVFNSIFANNSCTNPSYGHNSYIELFKATDVKIYNCTFMHSACGAIKINTARDVSINGCNFTNLTLTLSDEEYYGSAIFAENVYKVVTINSCHFVAHRLAGTMGGVIYSTGGSITLSNSYFDLYGLHSSGNAIYAYAQFGKISNTSIKAAKPKSVTFTIITLITDYKYQESYFGWQIDLYFNVNCPKNYDINIFERDTDNYFAELITSCQSCSKGHYSLNQGLLFRDDDNKLRKRNFSCMKCPTGAICDEGKVISKDNYWGYVQKDQLLFLPCLPGYCCSEYTTPCSAINTCVRNRNGTLCGACKKGFSENLLTTKCVENGRCTTSKIFLTSYIIFSVIFVYILIYIKDICKVVERCIIKSNDERLRRTFNEPVMQPLLDESDFNHIEDMDEEIITRNSGNDAQEENNIAGVIKIIFQFYQISSLVRISTSAKIELLDFTAVIADVVVSVFNIKFTAQSMKNNIFCPFPDLNMLQKEALVASLPIALLTVILASYVFLCIYSQCRKTRKQKKKVENSQSDCYHNGNFNNLHLDANEVSANGKPENGEITFDIRLKSGIVQIMLLGYFTISVFLFKCVHCVAIKDEQRLYIQGDTICYTDLQYFVWFIIATWVLPFCFSIYASSWLLTSRCITPNQFLLTLFLPPAVIVFLLQAKFFEKRYEFTEHEEKMADNFRLVLSEPFRKNDRKSGSVMWEFVLIVRKLVFTLIYIFVMQPVLKLYVILILLIVAMLHHGHVRPYNNKQLNALETLTLFFLCGMCALNIFWAFSYVLDITSMPYYELFGRTILYIEILALMFPFILLFGYIIFSLFKWCYKKVTNKQD